MKEILKHRLLVHLRALRLKMFKREKQRIEQKMIDELYEVLQQAQEEDKW